MKIFEEQKNMQRNQEVILLEASHRLVLIEGQKEMAWRFKAIQEKWRNLQ